MREAKAKKLRRDFRLASVLKFGGLETDAKELVEGLVRTHALSDVKRAMKVIMEKEHRRGRA